VLLSSRRLHECLTDGLYNDINDDNNNNKSLKLFHSFRLLFRGYLITCHNISQMLLCSGNRYVSLDH